MRWISDAGEPERKVGYRRVACLGGQFTQRRALCNRKPEKRKRPGRTIKGSSRD